MSEKLKDRFIGFVSVAVLGILSFLAVNYFGSFETKAASKNKFDVLDGKLDQVICYLDESKCLIQSI